MALLRCTQGRGVVCETQIITPRSTGTRCHRTRTPRTRLWCTYYLSYVICVRVCISQTAVCHGNAYKYAFSLNGFSVVGDRHRFVVVVVYNCLSCAFRFASVAHYYCYTTDLAKMSLSSWSDTNCPRLATNSVEQGGWGCCWLGGEGRAGEGRNGRPCGPSVNVGWKRANPNMILLRIE